MHGKRRSREPISRSTSPYRKDTAMHDLDRLTGGAAAGLVGEDHVEEYVGRAAAGRDRDVPSGRLGGSAVVGDGQADAVGAGRRIAVAGVRRGRGLAVAEVPAAAGDGAVNVRAAVGESA